MDVSLESKSLPSVGYSRKSYLQTTSQRLARGKLVHFHGWKSLALPSVGPGENGVCEISQMHKRAAKSLHNNMLSSQGCEVGFHLEVLSSQLAAYIGGYNFFVQLRIAHRLKHWILDFLRFEMCSFLAYFERLRQRTIRLQCLFLRFDTYPEVATTKDQRALRSRFRRSYDDRGSYKSLWSTHGRTHASPGHEFILVAIDYFTKWVEVASYARLTSARVANFIRSHIICHYGVPDELISDRGTKMGLLIVALEQPIYEIEWAQARFDQPNLLDERRLRVVDHVQAYKRKMARAFRKRVKPKPLQKMDLVLRILRGLVGDPRGKFRSSWSRPYVIRELTSEGVAWLTDLDGNQFSEPLNVDQLKKYYFIDDIGFILLSCIRYPHWDIFLIFSEVPIVVGRHYTGAYSLSFDEISLHSITMMDARLSTSLELSTIDCIETSLHGFVEIEMDHIRLDYPDEQYFVNFEICF
ncbi:hypothetical protein CK203_056725 [Vitis vinifera]|uniref:Integrase catalytic domain-containing protein n=1 Tax=Vitis vinifera TaxID=29760 RepID=A0A438GDY9_VITVI|nr:hypothetical protein CK203_056725 [Vitis vinifera]